MYVLRRYCGVGWHESEYVIPEWERELLLEGIYAELGGNGRSPEPDDDQPARKTPGGFTPDPWSGSLPM